MFRVTSIPNGCRRFAVIHPATHKRRSDSGGVARDHALLPNLHSRHRADPFFSEKSWQYGSHGKGSTVPQVRFIAMAPRMCGGRRCTQTRKIIIMKYTTGHSSEYTGSGVSVSRKLLEDALQEESFSSCVRNFSPSRGPLPGAVHRLRRDTGRDRHRAFFLSDGSYRLWSYPYGRSRTEGSKV